MPEQHPTSRPKVLGQALGWRLKATRYLYNSHWFDLRQDDLDLPDGQPVTFTYVEHPGFVSVVPLTNEGDIVMIRSYRWTVDAWCWEVPAGGLGNRPGLPLERVAREELLEETGHQIEGRIEHVTSYHNGIGNTRTRAHVFFATGVRTVTAPSLEATEMIEVHPLPARQALEMARRGEVEDGSSALALLLCAERIEAALRSA
jgi:ADP-ribose pyrophosphatase